MDEYDYKKRFFNLLEGLNCCEHRGDVAQMQIDSYETVGIEAEQCYECYGVYPVDKGHFVFDEKYQEFTDLCIECYNEREEE